MKIHYLSFLHFSSLFVFAQVSAKPSSSCVAKPKFRMCIEDGLEVMENMPKGTFVGQVRVEVAYPLDEENPIEYSIAEQPGEDFPFSIDNSTGVISTNRIFDRDEPANDHKFYVTVLAKGQDNFWLYDSCLMEVIITDDNDNAPFLLKREYFQVLRQNSPVGQKVMELSAYDIDDGRNSILKYSIRNRPLESSYDAEDYFRVNSTTGEIFLKRIIDKALWFEFEFSAKVEDHGIVSKFIHTKIRIQIVPSDLQIPSFYGTLPHLLIPEFNINKNLNTGELTAASNIKNKPNLFFELVTGRTEQTNKEKTFRLESLGDKTRIVISKGLDYERIKKYWLIVRATNEINMTAEVTVRVDVRDVNDNIPVIRNIGPLLVTISGYELPGYSVMQVHAHDADHSNGYNHVNYYLGNHLDIFAIDNETGVITTVANLKNFHKEKFDLLVYATEGCSINTDINTCSKRSDQIIPIYISRRMSLTSQSNVDPNQIIM